MLNKLLNKMGLVTKGKVSTKQDPIADIQHIQGVQVNTLTETEVNFVLTKLRSASYTGAEFETFSNVWIKLVKLKEK